MAISNGSLTDVNGNALTSQVNGTQQALDVGIDVGGVQIDPRQIRPLTSSDNVTVASSALPTGAATSANQATEITHLNSIDTKLPSQGQAASVASVPVVIASDQSAIPVISSISKGTLTDRSGVAGTVSVSIIPANSNRKYLLIQNVSPNQIYINFGVAATIGQGSIFLSSNGGSFTMEGEFLSTDQIFAISNHANSSFTAKEG